MTNPDSRHGSRLLNALRGDNFSGRPPVWIMRQAGRTLASYRKLREGTSFVEFCRTPALAGEATLLPVRELGVDGAILFADILLPIESWGIDLRYEAGVGPITTPQIQSRAVLEELEFGDVRAQCAYLTDVIGYVLERLPETVPLIGFAPSPWTLAAYVVEGQGKRGFPTLKRFFWDDPDGFAELLDRLTDLLIAYSQLQIEAGVAAFQVFDTWAELLPPAGLDAVVLPRVQRLLEALTSVPRIYFPKGTAAFVDAVADLPCEAVGCDWSVDLVEVRRRLGPKRVLQGNLDPGLLYASPQRITAEVHRHLDRIGDDPAYVFNLGHGLAPDIPEAHVHALVDAVHSWDGAGT